MKGIFQRVFNKFGYSIHQEATLQKLYRENEELHERIRDLELHCVLVTQPQVEGDGLFACASSLEGGQHFKKTFSFYDLDIKERERIVSASIDSRQTLISRWEALALEKTEGWAIRAQQAASMLGAVLSVADVGCGMMTLEKYLPRDALYVPVDVVRRDPRTIVIDLNKVELPDLGTDSIVGLGLLEYLFDVPAILQRIALLYRTAVLSYNSLDRVSNIGERTGHAWVNHYTEAELESLFNLSGLKIDERVHHDANQTIWRLKSSNFIE
ncbi:Methyltransferase domain-containing protein [Paraburkholderia sacchari]